MSGFYLMHRGWLDNPVLSARRDPYCRRAAWAWLIENAHFRPAQVRIGKTVVQLERGQLCHSLRFLAKAWEWDEARVRRFLGSIQDANMIRSVADAGQTVITICNYEQYQDLKSVADAPSDADATQERRSTDAKKKEGNKGKEGKIEPIGSSKQARGQRLSPDFVIPDAWISDAEASRLKANLPPADLQTEAVKFCNWATSAAVTKTDWRKTWLNWSLNAKGSPNGRTGQLELVRNGRGGIDKNAVFGEVQARLLDAE